MWRLRQRSAGCSRGSLKTRWIEAGTSTASRGVTHTGRRVAHAKLGWGIRGHVDAARSAWPGDGLAVAGASGRSLFGFGTIWAPTSSLPTISTVPSAARLAINNNRRASCCCIPSHTLHQPTSQQLPQQQPHQPPIMPFTARYVHGLAQPNPTQTPTNTPQRYLQDHLRHCPASSWCLPRARLQRRLPHQHPADRPRLHSRESSRALPPLHPLTTHRVSSTLCTSSSSFSGTMEPAVSEPAKRHPNVHLRYP
jgi:hypothetical protein